MITAINIDTGSTVNLDHAFFEAECPDCGKPHQIDLVDTLTAMEPDEFSSFDDIQCYCARCTAQRMEQRALDAIPCE